MRKVFAVYFTSGDSGVWTHTETNSQSVARLAVDEVLKDLDPPHVVIVTNDGRVTEVHRAAEKVKPQ